MGWCRFLLVLKQYSPHWLQEKEEAAKKAKKEAEEAEKEGGGGGSIGGIPTNAYREKRVIVVTNLSLDSTEDDIRMLMEGYGRINTILAGRGNAGAPGVRPANAHSRPNTPDGGASCPEGYALLSAQSSSSRAT